jgi:CO dehydrogenase/acetyl-CoA synthase beta subunit
MDKVADGSQVTTVEQLLPFLEQKGHPAPSMDSIIG